MYDIIGDAIEGVFKFSFYMILIGVPAIIYCEYLLFDYLGFYKAFFVNASYFGLCYLLDRYVLGG